MRGLHRVAPFLALSSLIVGCTPPPQHYANPRHPQYAEAEYLWDLAQCRQENSTPVVSTIVYETHSTVHVNDTQADGCMTRRGWQPVSTAVSWSPPFLGWPGW
jgi:hypothetical protein